MSSITISASEAVSLKPVIVATFVAVALVIAIHFFMLQVVFPNTGGFVDIYVPAKNGGKSYFTNPNEFQAMSYIAIGIAVALAVVTNVLAFVAKQQRIAVLLASFFLTCAGIYGATILGNGLYELLGDAWFILGVAAPLAIAFGMETYLLIRMKSTLNPRVNKG